MSGGQGLCEPPRVLRLYIAEGTPGGRRALENRARLMAVLDEQSWAIEVIDILARPDQAEAACILATPTLSDETAEPPRRIVGDLTDIDQIIDFFGCRRKDTCE